MKVYIDTSILTGAYCAESGSKRAQRILQRCQPVISSLTRLEFNSSVARKLRMKTYSKAEAALIIQQFREHLGQRIFETTPINESHYDLANEWVASFVTPLRTLDALHLAVAHSSKLPLVTADTILAKSAKRLGVAVERV